MWPPLPSSINEHNLEKTLGTPVFINKGMVIAVNAERQLNDTIF